MTSRSSEYMQRLRGRQARWEWLPGVHVDLTDRAVAYAVFDGERFPIFPGRVDPGRVYETVYEQVRDAMAAEFTSRRRETDRSGTWTDCERMAEKVARKCERLPVFSAWLVLSV